MATWNLALTPLLLLHCCCSWQRCNCGWVRDKCNDCFIFIFPSLSTSLSFFPFTTAAFHLRLVARLESLSILCLPLTLTLVFFLSHPHSLTPLSLHASSWIVEWRRRRRRRRRGQKLRFNDDFLVKCNTHTHTLSVSICTCVYMAWIVYVCKYVCVCSACAYIYTMFMQIAAISSDSQCSCS